MKVSASFLSSNNPAVDLKKLDCTDVDFIHVDVMDGKFVKNKTMPFSEMKNIYKYTSKRLDVHLMVEDPSKFIPLYASLNTEYITIHVELDDNLMDYIDLIKKYSIKVGLAIKPNTKISDIIPYLPYIDLILVMSVEPGMGGQKFIESTEDRIEEIKRLLCEYKFDKVISVDGGVKDSTVGMCKDANMVVSGSYIINGENFQEKISSLR